MKSALRTLAFWLSLISALDAAKPNIVFVLVDDQGYYDYGDATEELDHHVGRILDTLVDLKIDDRTFVIYASDNGRGPGRNKDQPIRGGKLSTYEGGIRVPAITTGPRIQSGFLSSEVIRAMDWYPTLATLAGIRVPEDRVMDGRDISPLMTGKCDVVPTPDQQKSLNADVPLRRWWDPPGAWESIVTRNEYNDAVFYHGSQGALAAVQGVD